MKFFTQFSPAPVKPIDFSDTESLTHQEFAEEADINTIIKRYQTTGCLVDPSLPRVRTPLFGDYSRIPLIQETYNLMISAREQFDALPIEIRRRFGFDPGQLLAFVQDKANRDEAIALGLIDEDETAETRSAPEGLSGAEQKAAGAAENQQSKAAAGGVAAGEAG